MISIKGQCQPRVGGGRTDRYSSQFENNYLTELCSGSEAGSYLRLIDFVYHSTLGVRVIKKKKISWHNRAGGVIQTCSGASGIQGVRRGGAAL